MQLQTGPVQIILVSLLLLAALLGASVLVVSPVTEPVQTPDRGGSSVVPDAGSTSQEPVDSPTVALDIETRGGTSLTKAKASLVVLPGTTEGGGTKLSLLTVSTSPDSAFDAERLSLVFANGERETQDLKQIVAENEGGRPCGCTGWAFRTRGSAELRAPGRFAWRVGAPCSTSRGVRFRRRHGPC
ncbi:hypothetical protein GGP50_002148 [Salinibacter ruber]|uniref:hypothetical protein n=1 Tax=Salinibacter ruber TaxID=146919 RepID=UPI002166D651|nr:hypothetical protein [Salinibacter ruber]MCS4193925.1 hypothetical protein [Salinibacter ruber]